MYANLTHKMWQAQIQSLSPNTHQYQLEQGGEVLSFRDWLHLLEESSAFADFYTKLLADCPFAGFFWEVKPMTQDRLHEDFAFVLVNSNRLPSLRANPADFRDHFTTGELVVSFANLGKDAMLVVPTPLGAGNYYAHLAAFLRKADLLQIRAFWQKVAEIYTQSLHHTPRWLSTSGLGVSWLHVRVDTRPKYYQHSPYRSWS